MIHIDLLNPKSLNAFVKAYPGATYRHIGWIVAGINLGILAAIIGLIMIIPASALPSPFDHFFLQAQKAFLRLLTALF